MRIIGIGDNVSDLYLDRGELYPGGNSVNVPVLARRFSGCEAAWLGLIGDDAPGQSFEGALAAEGVELGRIRRVHGKSAINYIELDEEGDRHFVGNNGTEVVQEQCALRLSKEDLGYLEGFDVAHTSIHSWLAPWLPAIACRVPLSLDFSDGYSWDNLAACAPSLRFAFLSGGAKARQEVETLAQYVQERGPQTVVVTCGTRGAYVLEAGQGHWHPCKTVDAVDTLGAGDAYIAAFLTTYRASNGNAHTAAEKADLFAGQCCLHYGAFGHPTPYQHKKC